MCTPGLPSGCWSRLTRGDTAEYRLGERVRGAAMIPTDTRSREARRLADRLLGLQIPSLVLSGYPGSAVDLRELAQAFPLVIYLYPGGGWSAQDGEDTPLLDAVQHRAFRRHQRDLEARGYQLIGV